MSLVRTIRVLSSATLLSIVIAGGAMAADTSPTDGTNIGSIKQLSVEECAKLKTDAERKGTNCLTSKQCHALKTNKERKESGCHMKKK